MPRSTEAHLCRDSEDEVWRCRNERTGRPSRSRRLCRPTAGRNDGYVRRVGDGILFTYCRARFWTMSSRSKPWSSEDVDLYNPTRARVEERESSNV